MALLTSKKLQRLSRQWILCVVLAATAAATATASSAGPAAAAVQRVDALAYEGRDEAAAPAGTCTTPRASLLPPVLLSFEGFCTAFFEKRSPLALAQRGMHL